MSVAGQSSAKVSLIGQPKVTATGQSIQFPVVARGYDRQAVDDYLHRALSRIERLEREAASFIGREVKTPEGQKLISELAQVMMDEMTGQRAAAEQDIADLISGAQEQAAQIIADARQQANDTTTSATQQAGSLVEGARVDAKNTRDQADAYAVAVRETSGARLQQVARIHHDTIARLAQMNQVTGDTLAAEQQRGPIEDEVARALAPIAPPAQR